MSCARLTLSATNADLLVREEGFSSSVEFDWNFGAFLILCFEFSTSG